MKGEKSLHRMLIVRIILVALVVSVVVIAVVISKERERELKIAQDIALIRIGIVKTQFQEHLDAPGLGDAAEFQRKLAVLARQGFDLSFGHYVFVRVLDLSFQEIAKVEDSSYREIGAVKRHVASAYIEQGGTKETVFSPLRIDGRMYVHGLVPLADSRGKTAAYMEGFYTKTPGAERVSRRNILESAALAVGIVLVTTLLLYPVIVQLMRRLERLSLNLLDADLEMLGVIGSTIAKRDSDTDAHNFRVTIYAVRIAETLGLDERLIRILIKGGFLHDVGKIGIRDEILLKPGKLDDAEFSEMKLHVQHGLDIVFRSTWLKEAAQVVGSHHEKYDGNGYPEGLRGEEIPVLARIFAIADVFDALTSHRPYKKPLSYSETIAILEKGRGSHFDPVILDVFINISQPLFALYGTEDDTRARQDLQTIVEQYYKADVATFLE